MAEFKKLDLTRQTNNQFDSFDSFAKSKFVPITKLKPTPSLINFFCDASTFVDESNKQIYVNFENNLIDLKKNVQCAFDNFIDISTSSDLLKVDNARKNYVKQIHTLLSYMTELNIMIKNNESCFLFVKFRNMMHENLENINKCLELLQNKYDAIIDFISK